MRDEAMLCTLNNVEWCDTVCRSHGLTTELGQEMWIQPRRGPPYYSNGITDLAGGIGKPVCRDRGSESRACGWIFGQGLVRLS